MTARPSAGEAVPDSEVFARLAQLGLHKLARWKAGDDSAFVEQLENSQVLDRVYAEMLRETERGQHGQNCGHAHDPRTDRQIRQFIGSMDGHEAAHPEWPTPREQALRVLMRSDPLS
ncbi:MAG: hypothetical protein KGN00_09800 [Chloroflexota bacterium]|nr:hypothetical protein [Chloroflexota bacterium]MDE3193968.1 hypothetical protein [Chloroflexota bacterium]